ncbi:MAG: polysaccharide deacetylase family protein, partial [Catenibacillus sp.]|nr:polysaccharide deacetylase family protein [Catenibacillus sp.]
QGESYFLFGGIRMKNPRKIQNRNYMTAAAILLVTVILIITGSIFKFGIQKPGSDSGLAAQSVPETLSAEEIKNQTVAQAERLAAGYDYDGACAKIKEIENYSADAELTKKITEYEALKAKTVRWEDMTKVTHIFFHSLIYDTDKAFKSDSASGYNMVMTTVDEFNKILQSMYDKGFVLVSIHDLVKEVPGANGEVTYEAGDIMLPPGKIPFVLSQDDVCYYEYMEDTGFATKLVVGEDGKVTCEYKNDDGTLSYGAYDMVPIVDAFIEQHPDFSYRGAKGILALTGYNGVLGYRTDPEVYKDSPTLQADIDEAKKVAEALKADGWEFASHSWGHIHMMQTSWEKFKTDTDKWEQYVEPIIGETDVIIYPFGEDVGDWQPYTADNQKYSYLRDAGFRYFCNVDGSQYWVQIGSDYVRQGRRNIDGQRMWQQMQTGKDWLGDLFDVNAVFDKSRPTPVYDVTG